MDAVGLPGSLAGADLVITGEGKLDEGSLHGKTPVGVIDAAREMGIPVAVVCGAAEVRPTGVPVFSLVERFGEEVALGDARRALEDLAGELAGRAAELSSGR